MAYYLHFVLFVFFLNNQYITSNVPFKLFVNSTLLKMLAYYSYLTHCVDISYISCVFKLNNVMPSM